MAHRDPDRDWRIAMAVDPGDEHQGVFTFLVSKDQGIVPLTALEVDREELYQLVESTSVDNLIIEEFRLYPFQARNQGFSDFPTPQTIGALKYIASRRNIGVVLQKAMIKKDARRLAETQGLPMKVRALGSGKGAYKGPDFDAKWIKEEFGSRSNQHVRDAMAHGYWWAWTSDDSPVRLDNY